MLLARLTGPRETHLIMADRKVELSSGVQNYARLAVVATKAPSVIPTGAARRAAQWRDLFISLLHKRRSLHSALRAPVEMTVSEVATEEKVPRLHCAARGFARDDGWGNQTFGISLTRLR